MDKQSASRSPFSQEWWRATLSSIGDAVMVTDAQGRVAFMNPAAQSLTGWPQEEAEGQPLEEVFVIVNEETRATVDNPVAKVMQTGYVVGLANHTVLITRGGGDIPIDDSAAPVRDESGELIGVVLIFRDITERRRTEAAQAYLAAIIDSSDDAIVGKTLESRITSWNKGAEAIFGYTAEEAVGKPIHLLIPPELQDEEERILERLKRGERIEHYETVRVKKDGQHIPVSLTISPIKGRSGRIIGASKIARDITERKQLEKLRDELLAREQAARKQAEEASRLKDEFLSIVSHELRTPLNSMLGWVHMLRGGQLNGAVAGRALETIERNGKAQARLIEDLLDISRIITGRLRLELHPITLPSVIEAAINVLRPTAEAKGVQLSTRLEANVGPVAGDADRLQQVVWNLISNAIKFTPAGGRVEVALNRVGAHVEIAVRDTGQGISAEFLPYVFERFRQADSSSTRMHGGLGLGLAITRNLVELHGGTIRAESAGEGQGANFTVSLPVLADERAPQKEEPQASAAEETPPSSLDAILSGLRILAVDDEPDTREMLACLLAQYGAEAKVVESAPEALEVMNTWQPDVLVCDISMPGEDGYALIRKVRALEEEPRRKTPAVALTAHARAEDRMRALTAGYQIHVPKPVEAAELVTVIASLAGRFVGEE